MWYTYIVRNLHRRRQRYNQQVNESTDPVKGISENSPYIILDEHDIAEDRDLCCNNPFGRTAREYAWHTGLHAVKYTVFERDSVWERVIWALVAAAAVIAGIVISVRAARFYWDSPVYIAAHKMGLGPDEIGFPDLHICPGSPGSQTVSAGRKSEIEEKLPPMAEMWDAWQRMLEQKFNPADSTTTSTQVDNYTWTKDPSKSVQKLMQQVRGSALIQRVTVRRVC